MVFLFPPGFVQVSISRPFNYAFLPRLKSVLTAKPAWKIAESPKVQGDYVKTVQLNPLFTSSRDIFFHFTSGSLNGESLKLRQLVQKSLGCTRENSCHFCCYHLRNVYVLFLFIVALVQRKSFASCILKVETESLKHATINYLYLYSVLHTTALLQPLLSYI